MKKLLFLLIALLAGVGGAWATDLTLTPANGTYVTSASNYVNSISFSTTPAITITASANNMDKRQTSDYLLWHSGSSGSSTYTISVTDGGYITAYSVTGEANTSAQTLTAGSESHEFAVGTSSTFTVTNLGASSVSFVQTGANASGLKITSISVTVEPIITSVSDLSNDKAYYVTTADRGAWMVVKDGTAVTSTTKADYAPLMSDTKQQFAFLTYGTTGVYHLYSVSEKKFVSKSGQYTTLTSELGDNVTLLTGTSNANYPVVAALQDGAYQMGISNGYDPAVITFWNSLSDGGNQIQIREVADFDPTDAMAILEARYSTTVKVTYEVYDDETLVDSRTVVQDKNSAVSVPAVLTPNTWYYDYTPSGSIGTSDCTITVDRTYKTGVVTSASGLSNNKAYKLVTERGTFTTDDGALANTCKTGSEYTIYNFAIVYYDGTDDEIDNGNYYLWSVQDSKFVAGSSTTLTETPTAITLNALTEPLFKIQCGSNYMNCNTSQGGFFSTWSTTDGGNQIAIIEAADFDPDPVIAALTNFAPSVITNIKPFFDTAGTGLFQLKSSVAETYNATYTAALTTCSESTYETLLGVVSDIANFDLPESGYYFVKNVSNNKYLRATGMTRGNILADVTTPGASSVVKVTIRDGKTYLGTQGGEFSWVYGSGYSGMMEASGKYAHFSVSVPGQGAFAHALGNGEAGYEEYLPNAYYAVGNENVVVGNTAGAVASQWTFEAASSITITLNSDGAGTPTYYATFCAPFSYTVSSGTKAYTLEESGSWLVPSEVVGEVTAGTPVLLKGSSSTATLTIGSYYAATPVDGDLTGTYLPATIDGETDYVLGIDGGVVGFYHWNQNTLGANRAYIDTPAAVKGFVINWNDADGITSVQGSESKVKGTEIYNLAGQRMNRVQKGVNIVNGKKVLVK